MAVPGSRLSRLLFSDSIELDNLRFVSLRWLRKLKQAASRHKDLDDSERLHCLTDGRASFVLISLREMV
jgi:hypothetical protein